MDLRRTHDESGSSESYRSRIAAEQATYENNLEIHNLPDIFHYWSNEHVYPKLRQLGLEEDKDLFKSYMEKCCATPRPRARRFASVGAGNCDLEIELALHLEAKGYGDFVIDCIDLNQTMLDRGIQAAAAAGVSGRIASIQADLNKWTATREYNAVIANQSLHHLVDLESVFGQIRGSLSSGGYFLVSDIMGRNGHQRWPEVLEIVHEFWSLLPPSYRFNHQLRRYEEWFQDYDCSVQGFEGIRSQDILPLLIDTFQFSFFFGFANVIEPFIDRSFGPNFDVASEWDRAFIDRVAQRDELEIRSGRIKPAHMIAALCAQQPPGQPTRGNLPPELCVRATSGHIPIAAPTVPSYQWDASPATIEHELEIACRRLKELSGHSAQLQSQLDEMDKQVEARTIWAHSLESELHQINARLDERTAWARGLDLEVHRLGGLVQKVSDELAERTRWALELNERLKQLSWAQRLDRWARRLFV